MSDHPPSRLRPQASMRHALARWIPAVVISLAALLAAPWLVGPRCPKHVVMLSGASDGAYFAFANRYRTILAKEGIRLEVRNTAGSIENTDKLRRGAGGASLALIQGGTASRAAAGELQSLASLYLEPVWVFCRSQQPVDNLAELHGKRIAVGREGSGTRAIALKLLHDNAIALDSIEADHTRTVDVGGSQAVADLKAGKLDAAFFVTSPQTPVVRELLETDGIELINFRRAAAYQRKYPFLSSVTLPEGLINLSKNVPSRDIVLLAPAANLVARADLHHALVPLLLRAVADVHEAGGLLALPEPFPSPNFVDYPLNRDARRYFRSGPSLFYRYLPFWLAAWLDRVKLVLLPMCTLLFPLLKVAPPIYRWRIRSKIYRWYRVLREIDQKLKHAGPDVDFSQEIANLAKLEGEIAEVSVPLSYMEEFYNLRLHVSFVLKMLHDRKRDDIPRRLVA